MSIKQHSFIHVEIRDQDTSVEDNGQEKDGQHLPQKELDLRPRKVMPQEGDAPSSKRFRIITEDEKSKWSRPEEKYMLEKDVKESILIKAPRPDNLGPVKKLGDSLQELLKQKNKPQDIAIDNTLEKV